MGLVYNPIHNRKDNMEMDKHFTITYFDIDANNYRTCSGNYKIRF